jgi:UDP-N-acetylmuramoylalanine--D-glutamate ligase
MKNLAGQQVLVLGLGASGLALARWCVRHGSTVTVADTRRAPPQLTALEQLPGVRFVAGDFAALMAGGETFNLILRSPGLSPHDIAPVLLASQDKATAWGNELSLFGQALRELGQEPEPQVPAPDETAPAAETAVNALEIPIDSAQHEESVQPTDEALPEDDDSAPVFLLPPPVSLAYRPQVIAITGTNGKTTVTALTGQLVQRAGKKVAVAGNIGPTLLDTLSDCMDNDSLPDVWVLELSSFQLEGVTDFEPTVASVLNISQDHLDWHGSMEAYVRAKSAVYGQHGVMLLNRQDPLVMEALPAVEKAATKAFGKSSAKNRVPARKVHTFGTDMPTQPGDYGIESVNGMAWLVRASQADETIKRRHEEETPLYVQRLMPVDALRIRGLHNAANALAALGLAAAAGCSLAPMLHGLREYRGEPHRMASVLVVRGVEYFDDSKGTNVGATAAALHGLGPERRLVLILGGEGKGQDFTPLAAPVSRYVRAVVLIGRDAPLIRAVLESTGVELLAADSMATAVALAADRAQTGDAVLMSPACASFDMFDNYGHRAQVFCDAVQALALDEGVTL